MFLVGCFAAVAIADAAGTGGLSLQLSNLDLSSYPKVQVAMQLGGEKAAELGDLTKEEIMVQVDRSNVPVDSLKTSGQGVDLPVQTVLLLDESGSMKGAAITAAQAAANTFIDAMKPADTAAVEGFSDLFHTLQTFSGDTGPLKAAVLQLAPAKETALYDAITKALVSFPEQKTGAARYIILLSDGGDTASITTLDQTITAVRAAGIPVYAVGLKSQEFDSQPLQSIADASGGRYIETTDPASLTSIYQTLSKELHNQYLLAFTMPQTAPLVGRRQAERDDLGEERFDRSRAGLLLSGGGDHHHARSGRQHHDDRSRGNGLGRGTVERLPVPRMERRPLHHRRAGLPAPRRRALHADRRALSPP